MPDYRAYIVGDDGHFVDFEPLVCVDDAEATEQAKRLVDGHDVELWEGARLIAVLQHTSNSEASNPSPRLQSPGGNLVPSARARRSLSSIGMPSIRSMTYSFDRST